MTEVYQTSFASFGRKSYSEWQAFSRNIRERARVTRNQIIDRMQETAQLAGLDPQMAGLHAHNAMCGFETGHPWHECDYSLVRKVLWLEQRSFEPERLASRIIDRAWKEVTR
jgi:hypothetical protein